MEARLIPLNAVIALTTGSGGWPTPLRDVGFRLSLIEANVQSEEGAFVADAVLVRDQPCTVLLVECKSGANIEDDQAKKYASADARALSRAGSLPKPTSSWDSATVDVAYGGLEEWRDRLEQGLASVGLAPALITVEGSEAVRVARGARLGIEQETFPTGSLPPALVPVDQDSPVEEFIEHVRPAVVAAMARGDDAFEVGLIAALVVPQWAYLTRGAQDKVRKKIGQALRTLAKDEMRGDIRVEDGSAFNTRVVVLRSPERNDPRGRTQSYQRLRRRAAKSAGREGGLVPQFQLSLDDLASEGGLGNDG